MASHEIEIDLTAAHWRRSTYSNGTGGDCVEVADGYLDAVPVRDSKTTALKGQMLVFRSRAWSAFVASVKG
jgi:hypothetical protein